MRPLTAHAHPARPSARRCAALLLAGAAVAVTLTGCGGGDDVTTVPDGAGAGASTDGDTPVSSEPGPSSTEPPASSPAPGDGTVEADLTVAVDDGAGTATTSTLTCSGGEVGGTLATASEACAQLAEIGAEAFAAPPKDQMCTEIYGGPQTATISGTLAGEPVEATLGRTNGCEIGRWDALSALVGAVGADS